MQLQQTMQLQQQGIMQEKQGNMTAARGFYIQAGNLLSKMQTTNPSPGTILFYQ